LSCPLVIQGEETFSYLNGGDEWDFTECKRGMRQSPIDFPLSEYKIKGITPKDRHQIIEEEGFTSARKLWSPSSEQKF
jgi:hypothetical protein